MALTSAQSTAAQLVLAYLGRGTDVATLQSYAANFTNGMPTAGQLTTLFASAESQGVFGAAPTLSSVIYKSFELIGRTPTTQQATDWVNWATSQKFSLAQLPWEILKAGLATESTYAANQQVLWARTALAYKYAEDISANPTAVQALASSATAQANARALISAATDVTTAQAIYNGTGAVTIAGSISNIVSQTGQTFTLTTGIDQGASFTGAAGADAFSSIVNHTDATKNTINAGDSLVGGDGTDTLSVVASNSGNTTVTGFYLNSVETLSVQNADANAANAITVDLTNGSSVATVKNQASTAGVTLNNVSKIAALELNSAQDDTTINYTAATVTGAADTQNITLNGANTTANGTVTVNGIETIAITASGANSGSSSTSTSITGDASLKTVTIAGDKNVSLNLNLDAYASAANTGTVNAGSATGNVTATITATLADKLAVTGGSGNDSLTINTLNGAVTVDGGTGTDTLKSSQTALTQTDLLNVKGIENFSLASGSTVDLTKQAAEVQTVTYASGTGASTLTGVNSGVSIVEQAAGTTLGVTVTGAATGTNDIVNLTIGKTGTAAAGGTTGLASGTLTATGVETINVTSQGADADTGTNTLTIAGNSVKTVTVAGAEKFTLTQSGGSITSYDASTATAAQNTASISFATAGATVKGGTVADTLTTGSGADSIVAGAGNDTISAAAGNDTIDGGEGNDAITGGAGADSVTGGAGADTFTIANGDSTSSVMDTIADFVSGTDKLSLGQANTKFIGNFSDVTTALAAMTAADQSFFVTGTNQLYVVATQGTLQATDDVVKLAGVTSLAAADLGFGSQGAGNSITLTAASASVNSTTNTSATAKTTGLDDSISTQVAYLPVTTIDGGLGADTLTVTDGGAVNVTNISAVETLDLTGTSVANTVTNVGTGFTTAKLGAKGDSITMTATASVVVEGGALDDSITLTDSTTTATITGGAGNDTVTVGTLTGTSALNISDATGTADILKVASGKAADFSAATISGFETLLGVDGGDEVVTLTAAQFAGISTFNLGGSGAAIDTGDKITLVGAGVYDLTAKTVTATSGSEWILGTAGSTLKANAAQLQQEVTGTGATGGDTLAIANDAAFTLTTNVSKFQTVTYTGNSDKDLTAAVANFYKGTDGTTANDGASVITGSGTSNLVAGATNAALNLTAVAVTGFDKITFASTGDETLTADVADLSGVTLVGGGSTSNLLIYNGNTTAGTYAQDLSTLTITASDFDSLLFGSNTASVVTNLTVSEKAMVTGLATVAGTANGTENLIVTASGAAVAVNVSAVTAMTNAETLTINDGSGNNTITLSATDAVRAKTTVNLTNGGADTVLLTNAAVNIGNSHATINGFTAGAGAGGDVVTLSNYAGLITASTADFDIGNQAAAANKVIKVAAANATLADFTATTDGGNVEIVLAAAIKMTGLTDGDDIYVLIGGSGAQAGNTALYRVDVTTAATEAMVVELTGVFNSASVDNFVIGNFS